MTALLKFKTVWNYTSDNLSVYTFASSSETAPTKSSTRNDGGLQSTSRQSQRRRRMFRLSGTLQRSQTVTLSAQFLFKLSQPPGTNESSKWKHRVSGLPQRNCCPRVRYIWDFAVQFLPEQSVGCARHQTVRYFQGELWKLWQEKRRKFVLLWLRQVLLSTMFGRP